jgi:hypothetical protein
LIAATVGLMPVGLQQASAATPSATHVSATPDALKDHSYWKGYKAGLHAAAQRDNSYRQGYRTGYRNGYSDARDDCRREGGGGWGWGYGSNSSWKRGYSDGYDAGYASAEDRYC